MNIYVIYNLWVTKLIHYGVTITSTTILLALVKLYIHKLTFFIFVNNVRILWRCLQHLCEAWKRNHWTQKKMRRRIRRKRRKVKRLLRNPRARDLRSWRLLADGCGFVFLRGQSIEETTHLNPLLYHIIFSSSSS